MADEAKGGGGPPAAIVVSKLVELPVSRKTVEIKRWSYTRLMTVSQYLNEITAQLPEDAGEDPRNALGHFFQHGSQRCLEVMKLSVTEQYRDLVNGDMDAMDMMALLDEVFELNRAGDLLKKATGLAGSFVLGKAVTAAQKSETKRPPTPATSPA